jgi:PAS domain S-box-containing protein
VRASGAVRGNSIGLTAARFRTINARWRWRSKKAGPTEAWKPWRSGRTESKYRSSLSDPPLRFIRHAGRCGEHAGRYYGPQARRRERPAARVDRGVFRRRDHQQDLDGVITGWNRGAQALFGYTAREAVGNSVRTLIPPDRLDEESEILARIRRGEHIEHYETVRRRKDGTLIDISLTVSPVKNAAGEIVGASKIARNISERKRAEEALHLIVDESKHRIRNTLATVQAIAT